MRPSTTSSAVNRKSTGALAEKIDAKDPNPKWLATFAEKAEALSRGEFKGLLTRSGGKGALHAARASFEVPAATSDLLWTWNEISVLAGLRRVHAEIRDKGESPQLLAALVVGYANLGSLTEYHYSGSHKVYHARALLYAERLLRKTDESSWALWHRAYARMLLELHKLAAEDIAAAKKGTRLLAVERPSFRFGPTCSTNSGGDGLPRC